MRTRKEALDYALTFADTFLDTPFHDTNWQLVRFRPNGKAFLWTYEMYGTVRINVKVTPESRDFYRNAFAAVTAGYHQNKEHWNTVVLDDTVPDDEIFAMIGESYELISDSPSKRIYKAVQSIPRGRVATYGQIAALAGNPKMCRAVGNALHKNPDPAHIPCHRVVNAQGRLSGRFAFGGPEIQQERLEAEGVVVTDHTVDLGKYGIDVDEMLLQNE